MAGTKRKSADDGTSELSPVDLDSIEIPAGTKLESCNVVRGKINRFIESGEMKVGEFCDALGVSGNGYRRFLALNGKDAGPQSDTYIAAWEFFKKRELAGIKPPKKQKTSAPRSTSDSVPDVPLQGEESDAVEVFDSCDEIRRKIAAHLRKPGVTRAHFCRDLLAQYHTDKAPSQVQSAQLTRFMGYKGADTGNTSCVFYTAYVFFEKERLRDCKPKSKHREEMEKIWAKQGGFNITRGHQRGYYCVGDSRPVQDQYGRVSFR
ncbi:hypothetical protein BDV97DRAFT_55961 [Delphinella strobiligena]|nr:hypothetical protein BDV97DRAFT_55961 [Delphinella strobiligena]